MTSIMDISMYSAEITSIISAILLAGLIAAYLRMYRDTHAQFSLGLTIFAGVLFVQNIISAYSMTTMTGLFGDPLPAYLLGINAAEVLGIAILFKTTIR